jgi:general stress protein YciG
MTSQSPRIYLYKITFEEVPYYYYGVKKEKYFNQEYWGSPYTHKWIWNVYTPKKQILQFFDFTDEGWLEAQEVEKRLIKPFYNTDKWCLNESCGGKISLGVLRKSGKKSAKKQQELGLGLYSLTKEQRQEGGKRGGSKTRDLGAGAFGISPEERSEIGRRSAETNKKNGTAIFAQTFEERSEIGRRSAEMNKKNGTAIFALTQEQLSENGKKGGKISVKIMNAQRWECCETGFVSTAAGIVSYQKARAIDTSKNNRKRIS